MPVKGRPAEQVTEGERHGGTRGNGDAGKQRGEEHGIRAGRRSLRVSGAVQPYLPAREGRSTTNQSPPATNQHPRPPVSGPRGRTGGRAVPARRRRPHEPTARRLARAHGFGIVSGT